MIDFNRVFPNAENETRQFFNKFDGFLIESTERDSVIFTNGVRVSYSINVSSSCLHQMTVNPSNKYALPLQVVARVSMDGEYIESFGCISHHDNNLMLVWFQLMNNKGADVQKDTRDNAKIKYKVLTR
jgi:hypothetical protein|tara:strand:- start:151 stop:534 length:384 start_codon:yes stop_codon:yes gene_type:complete